ncbi:MAG: tetratricopeptide repeat protein, partial [Oceanococcaceae bacterium]
MAAGWERDVDDPLLREDIAAAAASQPSARLTDAAELARRLHTLPARRAAKEAAATAEARANALQAALEQSRRRRRWTSMVALLLGLGLLGTGLMYGQVRSARDEALEAQAQAAANQAVAEAINRFLVEDLLAQANPLRSGQDDVPIRELLGRAASEAEARFAAYPAQEAAVRVAIGQALAGIGQLEEAASELERALSLPALPPHLADQARLSLGDIHATKDLGEKARPLLTQAIQASDSRVRLKAEALLARLDYLEWKFDLALERIDRVLPETRAVFGPRSAEVAWLHSHRGQALAEQGVFPQALEDAQLAADIARELYGPEDLRRIDGLEALGTAFTLGGRLDEAESIFAERHRLTLDALGTRHDLSLRAATDLAYVYRETDRLQQAVELLTPVLQTRKEDFGKEHVLTRNVWTLYA